MADPEITYQYLVMLPLHPLEIGPYTGKTVPHCTLMHWFTLSKCLGEVGLKNWLAELKFDSVASKIELVLSRIELFGPDTDVPVYVVEANPILHMMHRKIASFLTAEACILARTDWIGENYRPHVTILPGQSFTIGSMYTVGQLALIRRCKGQCKEVIQTVPL